MPGEPHEHTPPCFVAHRSGTDSSVRIGIYTDGLGPSAAPRRPHLPQGGRAIASATTLPLATRVRCANISRDEMLAPGLILATVVSAGTISVASPDFAAVNVPADVSEFCNSHLAQQLSERGLRVVTARELKSMLGLERQRELLGCASESSSCTAELAAALGTDAVLLGDLGRLGKSYQINIKVLRSTTSAPIAYWSRTVGSEDELLPALNDAAREIAAQVLAKLGGKPVAPAAAPTVRRARHLSVWPAVVAVAFGVASAGCLLVARLDHDALVSTSPTASALTDGQAGQLRGTGVATQITGFGTRVDDVWFGCGGALSANMSETATPVEFTEQGAGAEDDVVGDGRSYLSS